MRLHATHCARGAMIAVYLITSFIGVFVADIIRVALDRRKQRIMKGERVLLDSGGLFVKAYGKYVTIVEINQQQAVTMHKDDVPAVVSALMMATGLMLEESVEFTKEDYDRIEARLLRHKDKPE